MKKFSQFPLKRNLSLIENIIIFLPWQITYGNYSLIMYLHWYWALIITILFRFLLVSKAEAEAAQTALLKIQNYSEMLRQCQESINTYDLTNSFDQVTATNEILVIDLWVRSWIFLDYSFLYFYRKKSKGMFRGSFIPINRPWWIFPDSSMRWGMSSRFFKFCNDQSQRLLFLERKIRPSYIPSMQRRCRCFVDWSWWVNGKRKWNISAPGFIEGYSNRSRQVIW